MKPLKIDSFQDLEYVLNLVKPFHVKRLKIGTVEIEIDTAAQLLNGHDPSAATTIDDKQAKIDTITTTLSDLLKEQEADETWSV